MAALQSVSITCNDIALGFLAFLHTLRTGRGKDEIYRAFLTSTRGAFNLAGIAQAAMLDFREDIRIVVGRIMTILSSASSDGKDISSFVTESSQSLLELATGVEECNAILEEYREAIKEAQRQSLDENDDPPSEEEFHMVQEKWQAYKVIAEPTQYDWPQLKDAVIGDEDYDGPAMSSSDLAESTLPSDSLKSRRFSFWRNLYGALSNPTHATAISSIVIETLLYSTHSSLHGLFTTPGMRFPQDTRDSVECIFLQMDRLNNAFEAAHVTHASSEAQKLWLEVREHSAQNMKKLQNVTFDNYNIAFAFLAFLRVLRAGGDNSKAHHDVLTYAHRALATAEIAQKGMLAFREDIRIAVGRITTIISDGDGKDIPSFVNESSQSLLELATGVEECNAILEGYRQEIKEVLRQTSNQTGSLTSEEEFRMVHEKWQAFVEIADPGEYRWESFKDVIRGHEEVFEPDTPPISPTNPTMPTTVSLKSHKVPFWRKFFQRI
ncbi:hypothetical protein AGABI2DRAFT_179458 [Agaricus bisporus var. bisporus H97]|uniref:hypothetical protein n=1 Tax=Agaricus bisporus var. bisporus (strain H97 / ATCC MYA-4626 / FGSC 10389) TaxID=936046 RepID=UPI00029F71DA|nr:hypothetical protein AGABI2DRAFT_179458 [Agaricus bisporus var. bisporus H97]EKV46034.1 hypothetical protein AGABI2DRAFT_179458 [Agaricus bisporus var. bisporus H97]